MNQRPKDLHTDPRGALGFCRTAGSPWLPRLLLSAIAFTATAFFSGLLLGSVAEAREKTPGSGNPVGQQIVKEALKYEGVPYVLGGPEACAPGWQMDCTCLTTTVFKKFGFELPDMPTALPYYGVPVYGPPQAGDVHVWGAPGDGTGGHVAIDLGNGYIVHANMVTMSTSVTPMYYTDPTYLGAWRLVN